jgi:hypothetical protein
VNRRLFTILLVITCCLCVGACSYSTTDRPAATAESVAASADVGDAILARAFAERTSDLEVEGQGTVVQLLADDTSGARHQRFIVQLANGQTLLIVHDIDIAPRVGSLLVGHTVSFKGEYVWNAQGGLVHWTHHDPTGSHEAGWIKYDGQTYE